MIDAPATSATTPAGAFDALQVGDANATDSVTYRVKDPANARPNTVTVSFTITPVNDAPKAVARTYNAIANAALELEPTGNAGIGAPKVRINGDLVQGATDPDDPIGATPITDQTVATTGGGSVDLDPDGSFVYTSQPGETATTDTFQFEISDPHSASSVQTVSLDLKARVWFVDVDNAGAADGTSTKPFATTTAAATAGLANDTIYVGASASQTPSAATLKNGQVLRGAGEALTVNLGATGTPSGTVTLAPGWHAPGALRERRRRRHARERQHGPQLNIDPSGTAKGITAAAAGTVTIADVAVNRRRHRLDGHGGRSHRRRGHPDEPRHHHAERQGPEAHRSSVSATGQDSSIAATGGEAVETSGSTGGTLDLGAVSSSSSPTYASRSMVPPTSVPRAGRSVARASLGSPCLAATRSSATRAPSVAWAP